MRCKQAVELIDKYLDKRLEASVIKEFTEHLEACNCCANAIEERKELINALNIFPEVKATDSLKDSIMEEVYKIGALPRAQAVTRRTISYPVFKRLGVSMLFTAAIMLFGLFIPPEYGGAINSFAAEKTNAISSRTNQLTDKVTGFDKSIIQFFKDFNDRIESLKEV